MATAPLNNTVIMVDSRSGIYRAKSLLVSVIIPCYNQAHFLSEAIESVLTQGYPCVEIIVVDDGSSDNTAEIAAGYPSVRCIRQKNQGLAAARNTGLRASQGSYLVFLDADDRLLADALEIGVKCLLDHPECAFVSGDYRYLMADGSIVEEYHQQLQERDYYARLLRGNYIGMHATVMYRRDVFDSVGAFDTSLSACEDYDLYLRITRKFSVCTHGKMIAEYRKHSANMTRNAALMLQHSIGVLRSQRQFVRGNKDYLRAYEDGIRYWQHWYGNPLIGEVRQHLRMGEWMRVLQCMVVLMYYYPQGIVSPIRQRLLGQAALYRNVLLDRLKSTLLTRTTTQSHLQCDALDLDTEQHVDTTLVSVIIPCYNQAHFLAEAIESVLAQTYPFVEIVVVDDGSSDNTEEVALSYPAVKYIRQQNQGLAGARNTGFRESRGGCLVFLDADDRLLPNAIDTNLEYLNAHPECVLVCGHCNFIAADGSPLREAQPPRIEHDLYTTLLSRRYWIIPAAVMFRRSILERMGGFNADVNAAADYELYFRIAREYPVYCHNNVVGEYRRHNTNMTNNAAVMLRSTVKVLRLQRAYINKNDRYKEAYRIGMSKGRREYGLPLARAILVHAWKREWSKAIQALIVLLRYCPQGLVWLITEPALFAARHVRQLLPQRLSRLIGRVQLRLLGRVTPISRDFGYDRGLPIDRYYIERFLAAYAADIHGRVLEIGDNSYTRQFGGDRVTKSDVLHVVEGNPQATFVGDLTHVDHLPSDAFDCLILTQTLHLIYDLHAAVATIYRILKPGGVMLATVPGISQISRDEWSEYWHWSFTTLSARRLFAEVFPTTNVMVEAHGNVLAAAAFLYGLATQELRQQELDYRDPQYEVLITIRVVKPQVWT